MTNSVPFVRVRVQQITYFQRFSTHNFKILLNSNYCFPKTSLPTGGKHPKKLSKPSPDQPFQSYKARQFRRPQPSMPRRDGSELNDANNRKHRQQPPQAPAEYSLEFAAHVLSHEQKGAKQCSCGVPIASQTMAKTHRCPHARVCG